MARGRPKALDLAMKREHHGKWVPGSSGALMTAAAIAKRPPRKMSRPQVQALIPPPEGPFDAAAVQKWARDQAWNAIQALVAVTGDVRAAPASRVAAATALLDRAYGKPVAPLAMGGIGEAPFKLQVEFIPPDKEEKK